MMKNNEVKIANPAAASGVGRPEKYHAEFAQVAYRLALVGLTDKEIAETLCVSKATLNKWKKQYPEFMDSVRRGKTLADGNVAYGLYQRATGIEYEEVTQELDENGILKVTKIVKKFIPPDPGAGMNWLKNRKPELWREKQQIEFTGDMIVTMNLKGGDAGKNETGQRKELPEGWDSFEIQNELDNLNDDE